MRRRYFLKKYLLAEIGRGLYKEDRMRKKGSKFSEETRSVKNFVCSLWNYQYKYTEPVGSQRREVLLIREDSSLDVIWSV